MKRHCRWVSVIWIPAFAILAQEPPAARAPSPDLSKAQVTVVFAPDWNRIQRTSAGDRKSSLHSLDTPPAQILSALTGGRTDGAVLPAEFVASDGMTGIRLGPESILATTVVAPRAPPFHRVLCR